MAHGQCNVYDVVIASGASTSNEVNFQRCYGKVVFDSAGAAGECSFQVAPDVLNAAGTYRTLKYPVLSGTTSPGVVQIASAASGSYVEIPPLAGHQFVKVVVTGTIADGATLKFICGEI